MRYIICKYFLVFLRLSFDEVHIIYFSLVACA